MIDIDQLPMRVGLGQFQEITPTRLQFINLDSAVESRFEGG